MSVCTSVFVAVWKSTEQTQGSPQEQKENEKLLESAQRGFLLSPEEDSSSPAQARPST